MRLSAWLRAVVIVGGMALAAPAPAQKAPPAVAPQSPAEAQRPPPGEVETRHSLSLPGRTLDYTAAAGTLEIKAPKGEHAAHIFFTAYTMPDPAGERPVTFVFNGGPGAASAFLHIGAMGPRVVNFSEDGATAIQPVGMADNPDTWLPFTDLVFVDPVATGYSRTARSGEEAERAFFGVDKDADAMAEFVRLYLARKGRPLAPVFLAGESYGGFRVVLLADRLLASGTQVKGLVLISPALEFALIRGGRYVLLPEVLALPSIAAARLEQDNRFEPEALAPVEQFALKEYLSHVAAGLRNDPAITAALARFTGLSADLIARHHGRVSRELYLREYERQHDRTLSGYDASVGAPVPRPARGHRFDPILEGTVTVLAPAFERYAQAELGYRADGPYRLLNGAVSGQWDYGTSPTRQGYAGALDELQAARTKNPALRVLIAGGYTDLVTPYFVSRYLVDQLEPIETAAPIEVCAYRGGHMMYLRPASRRALAQDAEALYRKAMGGT
jgi:carboxypeptidase C (cathepsin A)